MATAIGSKKLWLAAVALFGVWSGVASAHGASPHGASPDGAHGAAHGAASNAASAPSTASAAAAPATSSAASKAPASADRTVVSVNGVEVVSEANHYAADGKLYVSLERFAALFGETYALSADRKQATFRGATFGVRMKEGVPTAWIRDLANAVKAQQVTWDPATQEAYVLALPEGSIKVSDTVPAMGEHWGNPQAGELPIGPFYGVHNGKLVFLEYMIGQDDFEQGVNHVNLNGMKGVPSPEVVQVDVEYQPAGHPGFEAPHYDIHLYFISDEEQQKIQ